MLYTISRTKKIPLIFQVFLTKIRTFHGNPIFANSPDSLVQNINFSIQICSINVMVKLNVRENETINVPIQPTDTELHQN